LGNKEDEFSVEDTSSEGVELFEEVVHLAENVVISLGVGLNVALKGGLELLAVDINSDGIIESDLVFSGIFTGPDRL